MADLPIDFVADLRNRRRWPELVDSLWRSPALVDVTYGRLWQLVAEVRPDSHLPPDPDAAVERIEWEWNQEHVVDHQLNRAADIEEPLLRLFRTDARSWHPYLYWNILVGLDSSNVEAEQATARLVAAWEYSLLAEGELSSVLVRFVGNRDDDPLRDGRNV